MIQISVAAKQIQVFASVLSALLMAMPMQGVGQKIGINNPNPAGLISLAPAGGKKISFWGNADVAHYGMASRNSDFQIFSDAPFTNIVFGTGSSTSFAEFMRITGNNQVGLGTTAPQFNLDIIGRLRLSSYILPEYQNWTSALQQTYQPANIHLNNSSNTAILASIGINRGTFGFYRTSDNRLLFGFNPAGAMVVNGQTGTDGQILMSNEFTAPPTWENDVVADMYNNIYLAFSANLVSPANIGDASVMTFVTQKPQFGSEPPLVVDVNSATNVLVKFDLPGSADCCGYAQFQLSIRDNGVIRRNFRYSIAGNQSTTITGCALLPLTAGSHNIQLVFTRISGPRFRFEGNFNTEQFGILSIHRISGKTF